MKLHEFLSKALQPEIYQRKGQRFMNQLAAVRPDLYERMYRTDLDCFYNDYVVPSAISFITENWEDRPE